MDLCQKVHPVVAYFQASAAPQPENPDSDEQDALFGHIPNSYFCIKA
jgi:hypothetical protein